MQWRIWQLIDSAFPTGGFAHSGGLEAAAQLGAVRGAGDLRRFARDAIAQAARGAVPFANAAHDGPERLAELDALCHAFLTNPVANAASRAQGGALLSSCARAFPVGALQALAHSTRDQGLKRHAAPLFGAIFKALGEDRGEMRRALLFISVRDVLSAAVRLGIVGPIQAQALQSDLHGDLDAAAARASGWNENDAAQTAPLIDVLQGTHERLYSRLFQS